MCHVGCLGESRLVLRSSGLSCLEPNECNEAAEPVIEAPPRMAGLLLETPNQ